MSIEGMSIVAKSNSGGFIAGMSGNCLAISCTSGWSLVKPAASARSLKFCKVASASAARSRIKYSMRTAFTSAMSRGTSAYAFTTSAGEIVSMARFSRMFSILSSIHPPRPAAGSTH